MEARSNVDVGGVVAPRASPPSAPRRGSRRDPCVAAATARSTTRRTARERARDLPRASPGSRASCRRTDSRRRRRARSARSGRSDRARPARRNPASTTTRRAPIAAAPSAAMIASGTLATMPHTRSPGSTPSARSARGRAHDVVVQLGRTRACARAPSSVVAMIAGASSRRRSTFSAKFRRASGKNRAPGMRSRSTTTRAPRSPTNAGEFPERCPERRRASGTDEAMERRVSREVAARAAGWRSARTPSARVRAMRSARLPERRHVDGPSLVRRGARRHAFALREQLAAVAPRPEPTAVEAGARPSPEAPRRCSPRSWPECSPTRRRTRGEPRHARRSRVRRIAGLLRRRASAPRDHQRAGEQLRQVADDRPSVRSCVSGVDDRRRRAEAVHERLERDRTRRARRSILATSNHGRPSNRSARACIEAAALAPAIGWPPTKSTQPRGLARPP